MGTRVRILFALLIVSLLGGLAWLVLRSSSPELLYQGRSLTYWTQRVNFMTSDNTDPFAESYWVGEQPLLEIGPRAIPFLINTLRQRDSPINKLYVSLWPKLPKPIQNRLPMPFARATMRNNAARGLALFGPAAVVALPDLILALQDNDKWARKEAATAFQFIGPGAKAAVPFLIQGLNDPDKNMRLGCLMGLTGAGQDSPEVVPVLRRFLKDSDSNIRAWAAIGLGKLRVTPEIVREALQEALQDEAPTVRGNAVKALGQLGPAASGAVPALLRLLDIDGAETDDPVSITHALKIIEALEKIGPAARDAMPALTNRLSSKLPLVSAYSARALWTIQPHNGLSVRCLMEGLKTRNFSEVWLRALGRIGPDALDALPLVKEFTKSPSLEQQMEATVAAWKIEGIRRPPLELLMNTYHAKEHSMVRRNAIELLGELGPIARGAIPTIIEATKDRQELTREFAREALKKVESK